MIAAFIHPFKICFASENNLIKSLKFLRELNILGALLLTLSPRLCLWETYFDRVLKMPNKKLFWISTNNYRPNGKRVPDGPDGNAMQSKVSYCRYDSIQKQTG